MRLTMMDDDDDGNDDDDDVLVWQDMWLYMVNPAVGRCSCAPPVLQALLQQKRAGTVDRYQPCPCTFGFRCVQVQQTRRLR
jgi:hypothetical protein